MKHLSVGARVTPNVSYCSGFEKVLLGKVATIVGLEASLEDCVYYELEWDDAALNDEYSCIQSDVFKEVK